MELHDALPLLLVTVAVAILPSVSRRLRVPSPVTEIMFGVLLGKSFLSLEMGGEWLPFLAHLGFLLLMFQAGMEINFTMLTRQLKREGPFQLSFFAATVLIALVGAYMLGQGMFTALILITTFPGLVMPVLKELGLGRSDYGQSLLMSAALADFLALLGITFVIMYHNHGLSWHMVQPLPLFLGFAALLWLLRLWAWWNPERAERIMKPDGDIDPQEQSVRYALALLFVFVGMSLLVGLEPVLGAFMGGAIISFVFREKERLESKISALGFGFLVPLFFIHVGMEFDVSNVLTAERLKFTAVLVVLAFLVKCLPGFLYPLWGKSLRRGLTGGLLLSSRLSLVVAAASVGLAEGLITEAFKDSVVLLALISCLAGPTLFKLTYKAPPKV
ncbi:cation:proton antiporter [Oceanidesulfovibrio indonesiensis]|uniref:Cation:proton antiporter n=1 Tax=Oceanidesulfovibrio indonesiensis TaxID=54767 RepID=A0A7M3MJ63_9BACT|nr:cation:proton antiporter [Oceanidesulfovibrio indonesiensis]TVM19849.1 cation:proton antiporter [Oceanidesulfovibrio indonesiensis]